MSSPPPRTDSPRHAALCHAAPRLVAARARPSRLYSDASCCIFDHCARYIKIMDKIEAKGANYPKEETGRIEKLLGGSLSDAKKEDLRGR